ncbi:protein kinase [Anaeromyxobacter sp. K]|uniref:protein kinase domain-containing protein n=1 Tax=Anaeromyxobacter sp. (strain K) TaxID=447217 RepID=UPI0035109C79
MVKPKTKAVLSDEEVLSAYLSNALHLEPPSAHNPTWTLGNQLLSTILFRQGAAALVPAEGARSVESPTRLAQLLASFLRSHRTSATPRYVEGVVSSWFRPLLSLRRRDATPMAVAAGCATLARQVNALLGYAVEPPARSPGGRSLHEVQVVGSVDAPATTTETARMPLADSGRLRISRLVDAAVAEIGILRARAIAVELGLVIGPPASTQDAAAELRAIIPDAAALAATIVGALEVASSAACAVKSLFRLATEAVQTASLPASAKSLLASASRSSAEGAWDAVQRATESLLGMRATCEHPLLVDAPLLISVAGQSHERILSALGGPIPAPPPRPKSAELPSTSPPTAAPSRPADGGTSSKLEALRDEIARRHAVIRASLAEEAPSAAGARLDEINKRWGDLVPSSLGETPNGALQRLESIRADLASVAEGLTRAIAVDSEAARVRASAVASELGEPDLEVGWDDCDRWRRRVLETLSTAEEETGAALNGLEAAGVASVPEELVRTLPLLEVGPRLAKILEEARRSTSGAMAAAATIGMPRASLPPPFTDEPVRFAFTRAHPLAQRPLSSGYWALKLRDAPRSTAPKDAGFLPGDLPRERGRYELLDAAPRSGDTGAANAGAHNVLHVIAQAAREEPLSRLAALLLDAERIAVAASDDDRISCYRLAVVGAALAGCAADRELAAARRRTGGLFSSGTPQSLLAATLEIAAASSGQPEAVRIAAELIAHGFGGVLLHVAARLADAHPADGRGLLEAIAIAIASTGGGDGRLLGLALLHELGLAPSDRAVVEDYLEDCEPDRRRGASAPEVPRVALGYAGYSFLRTLGARLLERGRGPDASKVGLSIPAMVDELYVPPGAQHLDFPVLVRNGGQTAAAGIVLSFFKPHKGDSPIVETPLEFHLPWLTDARLQDSASTVLPCRLTLNPERIDTCEVLRLTAQVSWLGGEVKHPLEIKLRHAPPEIAFKPMEGFSGEPVNLNDDEVLGASSASVQRCFEQLRRAARAGAAVRAVVYGRKRRGKSSICQSLELDPAVQSQYLVHRHTWNGPRMTTLATALRELAEVLRRALSSAAVDAAPLDVSDLTIAEDLAARYLTWVEEVSRTVKKRLHVLLLLDEFQKWLAGLGSRQERNALLVALRHFNERALGNLSVSFVLSGLLNLRDLLKDSNDFLNSVDRYEVRELTATEADKYLRARIPIELDERSRRRMVQLSGGNPYILNRLGGRLLAMLQERGRRWCTLADIDALLTDEEHRDQRLDSFVGYLIREDEDDNAASLRQLTVLRAVASILAARGDFDGHVRAEDVETWLRRNEVPYEQGQPEAQLRELAALGILDSRNGFDFELHGEWLCRHLASLKPQTHPLLPVKASIPLDLVLQRFRKTECISREGAQAEIWLADNIEGGHKVVLKLYREGTVDVARLVGRERDLLTSIKSPYVVRCLGGSVDERHGGVVVLEWVEGKTLDALVDERPAEARSILPGGHAPDQVALLAKLADGLAACHEAGVVHKDLSGRNVMLVLAGGAWQPKIIDFGIAGSEGSPVDWTTNVATHGYVAPEKLHGGRRTRPADIFSLGAVYVRILTGADPTHEAPLDEGKVSALLENAHVGRRLGDLVVQMLSGDPGVRPTAVEVRSALSGILQPETWRELRDEAVEAILAQHLGDAAVLVEKALSKVPPGERRGEEYGRLLGDAANEVLACADERIAWLELLLDRWMKYRRDGDGGPETSWDRLLASLREYCTRVSGQEPVVFGALTARLVAGPSPNLAQLVIALAGSDEMVRFSSQEFYCVLGAYRATDAISSEVVARYCVASARDARIRLTNHLTAELWLQRARSLGCTLSDEYVAEDKALAAWRRKTKRVQTLPSTREGEGEFKVGGKEEGHLKVDRIKEFAARVFAAFPFVHRIERVEKSRNLQVNRPTLLGLDNVGRHLPAGKSDPGTIIPIALDPSYTGDVVLRMNMVLHPETTGSQREAAWEVIRAEGTILDVA